MQKMKLALNLEAELLSPTERILATPKFHYLAISDAVVIVDHGKLASTHKPDTIIGMLPLFRCFIGSFGLLICRPGR